MNRRTAGLLLGFELALGLVLRLVGAGTRPIWYDDAFSVLLSRGNFASIVRGTAADTMPPLYYFLLHLWMTLTSSIAGWRLLGALLGAATIGAAVALALVLMKFVPFVPGHFGRWEFVAFGAWLALGFSLSFYHRRDTEDDSGSQRRFL